MAGTGWMLEGTVPSDQASGIHCIHIKHLHVVIRQTLLSKATYNRGTSEAIYR